MWLRFIVLFFCCIVCSQNKKDKLVYEIISNISEDRLRDDIQTLVNFGTRHTLSDTVSETRGIGAARRWIKKEFEQISDDCYGCLEVFYQNNYFKKNNLRLIKDVWINNVVAIQRGTKYPNRYIIMSGDIDSRVSDPNDFKSDSPGANDNATVMAGTIVAARVLSKFKFENSIIFVGLSGEEQGLYGGQGLAGYAKKNNWDIIGILNNMDLNASNGPVSINYSDAIITRITISDIGLNEATAIFPEQQLTEILKEHSFNFGSAQIQEIGIKEGTVSVNVLSTLPNGKMIYNIPSLKKNGIPFK